MPRPANLPRKPIFSSLAARASVIVMGAMTLMVAALVWVVSANLVTIRAAGDELQESATVRILAESVLTAALDQETGIRGFAESSNLAFLTPYVEGQVEYDRLLAGLESMAEDPSELARIQALRAAMAEWRRVYAEPVLSRPRGQRLDEELAQAGKTAMDAVRRAVDGVRVAENVIAEQRARDRDRAYTVAYIALFGAGGCTLAIGLGLGAWALSLLMRGERQALAHAASKTRILATVSHEIRTPLNGILGMLQAMKSESLTPTQADRVGLALDSGETLTVLLNDLLDASKIEARRLEVIKTDFELDAVLRRIHGVFAPVAEAKGVTLRLDIAPEAAGYWVGDKVRLGQIWTNLVSNAVKFTSEGEVVMTVKAPRGDSLSVAVTDTGIGMDASTLENLFSPYAQAGAETAHQFGGTGLGLTISRSLARLMGGDITVASTPGGGSSFTFSAPMERGAAPAPIAGEGPDLTGLTVLAADDNAMNRQVLATVLPALGVSVTLVEGGREAIAAWTLGSFDLVLLDLRMPGCDGFAVARHIRKMEGDGSRTPLILLSGDVSDEVRSEGARAGFDGFVPKPLEVSFLAAEIGAAVRTPVLRAA